MKCPTAKRDDQLSWKILGMGITSGHTLTHPLIQGIRVEAFGENRHVRGILGILRTAGTIDRRNAGSKSNRYTYRVVDPTRPRGGPAFKTPALGGLFVGVAGGFLGVS